MPGGNPRTGGHLVDVRDPGTDRYHLHVSNITADDLGAEHVEQTCALRWSAFAFG